ncbi:ABC transporter ATP-binding protein [Pedobacter frigiditerrae]|uniref:ABC transporter ATP-binding protein n=1 Tax=Pedobacter frigiditerrae TaxID=2530452 RepID=UPI002930ABDF|nr:ABC transporter ATP-binding protein [Pedobacter frigiditerrae]
MSIAIKVENLSKAYQLGQIGTGTISRDLERWYARIRGKEDPFLRIGESNDRSTKGTSDVVWSLKDINFEIEQGDAVGIIGRNGAGKSTLLKILSKVTAPTTGKISGKGRIASLLEVGTGFHPELSGRENIFLNGAILGMRKKEIQRKLEEIVDFAGIERYLDTPVKRYSSGMYVRLAFAVAAHLESEILIVDEVLAVGDAEFQKKCLGKMGEVSKGEGRTVLFVSHNMASVEALCNRGLILSSGEIALYDKIQPAIASYIDQANILGINTTTRSGIGNIRIDKILISTATILTFGSLSISIQIKNRNLFNIVEAGISIWTLNDTRLISISTDFTGGIKNKININSLNCHIQKLPLVEGEYKVNVFVSSEVGIEDYVLDIGRIRVESSDYFESGKTVNPEWGLIAVNHTWEFNNKS